MRGLLDLDTIIAERMPLERINDAFDELRKGDATRSVIIFAMSDATPDSDASAPSRSASATGSTSTRLTRVDGGERRRASPGR